MPNINLVFTFSKQHYFSRLMKCFYSSQSYPLKYVNLIKELTNSSENDVVNVLKNNLEIQLLHEEEVKLRINRLNGLELNDKSKLDRLSLLKHHPKTVKHRYLILQEFGVAPLKINTYTISKYLTFAKMKVSALKMKNLLETDSNIVDRMLSYSGLSHSQLDKFYTDSNTPDQIKMSIMKMLLIHCLGYPMEFEEKTVLLKRLRHKSIHETLRNIKILEQDVGISKEKLRKNPFLLSAADADNTLEILSTMPVIAGVSITTILNNHPKILASPLDNLLKIKQYLQEADISDTALSKCFEVFTLNSDTVRERLTECRNHSFFSLCRHHPRILELIMYQNKAKKRLDKLKEINVDYVSLNTLASSDKHFNRYFEVGSERHHGMDTVYFLTTELECDKAELRRKLQKHPYWIFTSLMTISSNLQALLERGFTRQLIFQEIYVLLYPTKAMLEELDKVCLRKESDACRDKAGVLRKSFLLPLTLYFLERDSSFTGGAIWGKEPNPYQIS